MADSAFHCDAGCGLCCSMVPRETLLSFNLPLKAEGPGCANLKKDKTCSIYESRPEACSVRAVWERQRAVLLASWEEWKAANRRACGALQAAAGWEPAR